MKRKLQQLLNEQINPYLQQHLGGCELVNIDEESGVAEIKLIGSCRGCPGKKFTFNKHIVPFLKENVIGLTEIKIV